MGYSSAGTERHARGPSPRRTWRRAFLYAGTALGLAAASACSTRTYTCSSDDQCVWRGQVGQCEPTASVCAYPDPDCPSMLRYGPYAGSLSRACVEPTEDPASSSSGGTGSTGSTGSSGSSGSSAASSSSTSDTGAQDTGEDGGIPLPPIDGMIWHVAIDGDDRGAGTQEAPFATLQHALSQAMPGDGVELADGDYQQGGASVRDGEADAPIVIYGSADAILRGDSDTILTITHDHHVIHGLTLDGLHGSPREVEGFRDHLVEAQGTDREGVEGLRLLALTLRHAADECVRLRYFSRHGEIGSCTLRDCGVRDYRFDGGGENGEGIFIGTPTSQWIDNPTDAPDASDHNWVHDNDIDTRGNECVDVQEGASHNLIEGNTCRGQLDPDSGGLNVRGSHNVVRDNTVEDCFGAGVRLGGFLVDGVQYGLHNEVTGNTLRDNTAGGIKIQQIPQQEICGNILEGNAAGDAVGDYGARFDPAAPC